MKSLQRTLRSAFLLAMLALIPSRVNAAYDMFLNLTGIQGEATASGHSNEIVVLSFSLSVSNSGGAAGGGTPTFSGLTITKLLDKASPPLVLACAQGTPISQAVLTLRDQSGGHVEFYKITLHNVFVSSVKTGGNGSAEARPTETVTFTFQQIQWEYQQVDSGGNPIGGPVQATFTLGSPA